MNITTFKNTCMSCGHQLCAKKVTLFQHLSEDQIKMILDLIQRKHFKKGDTILSENENFKSLYIVNTGMLKASHFSKKGDEQILKFIDEGESVGELALLKESPSTFHLTAVKETHVCTICKADFDAFISTHPEMYLPILSAAHDRIIDLEAHVNAMSSNDPDEKLQFLLKKLSKKGIESKEGITFHLDISRDDMANYVGVSRETISRKLSILNKNRIIQLIDTHNILVLNKDYLE